VRASTLHVLSDADCALLCWCLLQATTFEESPSREDWQALVDSIKQKE
jgi:hypothetical protein